MAAGTMSCRAFTMERCVQWRYVPRDSLHFLSFAPPLTRSRSLPPHSLTFRPFSFPFHPTLSASTVLLYDRFLLDMRRQLL